MQQILEHLSENKFMANILLITYTKESNVCNLSFTYCNSVYFAGGKVPIFYSYTISMGFYIP